RRSNLPRSAVCAMRTYCRTSSRARASTSGSRQAATWCPLPSKNSPSFIWRGILVAASIVRPPAIPVSRRLHGKPSELGGAASTTPRWALRLPSRLACLCARCCRLRRPDHLDQRAQRLAHALPRHRRDDQRCLLRRALEPRGLLLQLLLRQRIGLVERDDLRLLGEPLAVGLELGAHGLVGRAGVL